ncbi:MAG: zinc ribbon domain-containing protein [Chitinivibrionales bacterium]|nr:zinc ribbon domain-containing protein [Chitinivibrionales bacterium]MBD3395432.1 zinc ribbon domain-containing protein [Chitinivibrionales bacterium]
MPIYEYRCSACGNRFEELVSGANASPQPCPSCKSENTEKLMSAAGIVTGSAKAPSCSSASACAASGVPGCSSGCCPLN